MDYQIHEIWSLEERLWVEGPETWAALVDPLCVLALPESAGGPADASITDSLDGPPRWASVRITEQATVQLDACLVVLAYVAEALRPAATVYRALCTSTWLCVEDRWTLVQHQQTPLAAGNA